MNKLNKFLYLTIGLSLLAIILPVIFLQIDYIKTFALKTFHTRENAYGYLQFVGSFLGVVATIEVTIILQEKQKYQKEQDENKRSMLNLYVQLERAFEKYKEAQRGNLEYKNFENIGDSFGPREIFIDPNYVKDLAQLKPRLTDELYENIGLGFDAIINSYKAYLKLLDELNKAKNMEINQFMALNGQTVRINASHEQAFKKQSIINANKQIKEHVDMVCKLYDEKYKEILEKLLIIN
ncbi:hypothetical protein [Clostridium beijerinckii]|uniref:hypothetical protein n=1 Tax=Clostridium beijerinckii TaxID=1520 RepID=UPI000983D49F|nr:hypothetical protein [Clostridium beijerinckii]AQS04775.1 hypothetical protein CLBIJ_22050 [Clostridium beijerinckii]MBA2887548.1 hypothetical protein [Clostridium beijerinckii]MBC2418421.1 hypothetical protein [Clostridium beijerinckii]MBC2423861.1 hypothetical protein [Clostridium beijerinckii]MBC2529471.1 hypothetical protein [Clostridium beijerinckii]